MKKILVTILSGGITAAVVCYIAARHPKTDLKTHYECAKGSLKKMPTFNNPPIDTKRPYLPIGLYIVHLK